MHARQSGSQPPLPSLLDPAPGDAGGLSSRVKRLPITERPTLHQDIKCFSFEFT